MGVLVVTGSSRGIGSEICRLGAERGWAICLNYARSASEAKVVVTEMNERWMEEHPDWLDSVIARTPLGHAGEVRDIANATLWLLSGEPQYVTGAILDVSGGWVTP